MSDLVTNILEMHLSMAVDLSSMQDALDNGSPPSWLDTSLARVQANFLAHASLEEQYLRAHAPEGLCELLKEQERMLALLDAVRSILPTCNADAARAALEVLTARMAELIAADNAFLAA